MPVRIKLRFGCLFGSPFFFSNVFFLFPFRQDHPGLVWISCSLPHSCRVFSSFNSSLQPWRFSLVSFRGYRVSPQPCVFCGYFSFKVLAPWQQYLKKVEFFFFKQYFSTLKKRCYCNSPLFAGSFCANFWRMFFFIYLAQNKKGDLSTFEQSSIYLAQKQKCFELASDERFQMMKCGRHSWLNGFQQTWGWICWKVEFMEMTLDSQMFECWWWNTQISDIRILWEMISQLGCESLGECFSRS